jgi:hypothetical protein
MKQGIQGLTRAIECACECGRIKERDGYSQSDSEGHYFLLDAIFSD